jgi:hypothetical protein
MKLTLDLLKKQAVEKGLELDQKFLANATKKDIATLLVLSEEEPKMGEGEEESLPQDDESYGELTPSLPPMPIAPRMDYISEQAVKEGSSTAHASLSPEERKVKEELLKEPRVSIMIPLEMGEKAGATMSVTLNGYRLNIQKNVVVSVPRTIAEMIAERLQIQLGTGAIALEREVSINKSAESSDALN